jgi:hypothetical protein
MHNIENHQVMTFEEASKLPHMADVCEAIRQIEKIPRYERFPRKYKSALEHVVTQKLIKLFEENPNAPLKEVVLHSIEGLNDDLPAHLLLHIMQFAVKKWEKMSSEAMQKNSAMQLA